MSDMPAEFIAAVSQHTGVPECFLTGDTAEAVWDRAQRLVDWKASTAPPTAAVCASLPDRPITAAGCVPDGDYLTAWRTGRLAPAGIPAPPPRQSRGMPW
ncbi:MAG TPA: hypothetical protein VME67_01750 [Mycobacterium sp.]|nr:hypothetical protein [Mycobacterium sp.]HTX93662.1 hypothetical protein [Mycobacterium sp.]